MSVQFGFCARWCSALVAAVVFLSFGDRLTAQEPLHSGELLEWVCDAHRATRESVRSLHCRVKTSLEFEDKRLSYSNSSEFWCSSAARAMRLKVSGSYPGDTVWKAGIFRSLVTQTIRGKKEVNVYQASSLQMHSHPTADPYAVGLLVLNRPGTGYYVELEELVKQASRVGWVRRKTGPEAHLVAVQLLFDKSDDVPEPWEVQVFLDEKVSYLVRKVFYFGSVRRQDHVLEFKEFTGGIFFPTQVSHRSEVANKKQGEGSSTISDIIINKEIAPSVFTLSIPDGTILHDSTAGVFYKIDSAGNRISPETPIPKLEPPPPASDGLSQRQGAESEHGHTPIPGFFLGSLFLLLAGVLAWCYRRVKNRNRSFA